MVWALSLHVLLTRSDENSFSAWTWSGYWLWTGLGIGFACPQTWSGENSFSAQTWSRHGLAHVLSHGLGIIVGLTNKLQQPQHGLTLSNSLGLGMLLTSNLHAQALVCGGQLDSISLGA